MQSDERTAAPEYRLLRRGGWVLVGVGCLAELVGLSSFYDYVIQRPWRGGVGSNWADSLTGTMMYLLPGVLLVLAAGVLWAVRDMTINSWRLANALAPRPMPAVKVLPSEVEWQIRGMHKDDGEVDLVIPAISEAEARSLAFERGVQVVSISRVL